MDLLRIAMAFQKGRLWTDAMNVLDAVPVAELDAFERELMAIVRLVVRTYSGDVAGARKALDELPPLTDGSDHAAVRDICLAFLRLREGQAMQALEIVVAVTDPDTRPAQHMVLAHVHAALQSHREVERCLEWLRAERGDDGLRWVIDTCGPASTHAEAMLRKSRPIYR
jgi:hypothetical protein